MTDSVPSATDCSVCGSLPPSYLAQTGYGDQLPPAAGKLKPLGIDNRRDIWRCPACGALFDFEDLPQFFGSGNLDEERLDRLSESQAQVVRALLSLDVAATPPDELIARAARELPRELLHPILRHLRSGAAATFERLVPPLVELLVAEDDQPIVSLLLDWAGQRPSELSQVAGLLERGGRPLPRFGEVLLKLVRERLPDPRKLRSS